MSSETPQNGEGGHENFPNDGLGPLPASCRVLRHKGIQVILLGTAHISQQSIDETIHLIERFRPACVAVELCKERMSMAGMNYQRPVDASNISLASAIPKLAEGNFSAGVTDLVTLLLASVCEDLGLTTPPGGEFAAATQVGRKHGAFVVFADRPVSVTLQRCRAALSTWDKLRVLWAFLTQGMDDFTIEDVENLRDTDLVTKLMEELAAELPGIATPLLEERDAYLTFQIQNACAITGNLHSFTENLQRGVLPAGARGFRLPDEVMQGPGAKTVLAVVGAGHINGIVKRWDEGVDEEQINAITFVPASTPFVLTEKLMTLTLCSLGAFVVYTLWRRYTR